ncbi:putative lipolytic protein g-d-s-l family protein [Phaeoacremonium minimum UCRPA7]|uniref:Putative lipolytic protein g-d-s-l family protein n=1 Tax=Phaeoacremonium minimum (strain UCR-PA7) TaxID=1286976 RepID=R8BVH8_PHAM7|nr:putative lipolytic protein g-d-s-l family protein [Phaeoacremonium minimum UCRPA7]EOO03381.1 putative lipolytic protein g-d-s-l family protein [Phaeoacremonium minimum UCRPA7]
MLDDATLRQLSKTRGQTLERLRGVFNAGVGGDRIENMLYRLIGNKDGSRDLQGLAEVLQGRNVKLWVVSAGTNNLQKKKGLVDADVDKMRLLLDTLLKISSRTTKMLFSGLTYRTDIGDQLVDEANEKVCLLIMAMNQEFGYARIEYLPPVADLDKGQHLADHVHLNERGYQMWAEILAPRVMELYGS